MDDHIIAVMGATGSGKSSLIKLVTGDENVKVGHGLTSETQDISSHKFTFAGRSITLIDTPGFDDTYRADADILQSLVQWLANSYRAGTKLSGIIYLHRITDVRLQGSSVRNLRVFEELCGPSFFKHVCLCASFWSEEPAEQEVQNERLKELTTTAVFWKKIIEFGARVFKEQLTQRSAIRMITELLGDELHVMQIQREVVDENKSIERTGAVAKLMSLELERQEREHNAKLAELKKHFEAEMRLRERTHSENLEDLRQEFERKLALSEAASALFQAEISGIESVASASQKTESVIVRKQIPRKSLPAKLNRASTIPADEISIDLELIRRRQERYNSFAQSIEMEIQKLHYGKGLGHVKCKFSRQKTCYTMVCTNCLRNIGNDRCYTYSGTSYSARNATISLRSTAITGSTANRTCCKPWQTSQERSVRAYAHRLKMLRYFAANASKMLAAAICIAASVQRSSTCV